MAREAEFGLMIWDGKSPGTVLNVLRLVRAGKKAVLLNVHGKTALTFKEIGDWDAFLAGCNAELKSDLVARATPEEWEPERQADLLVSSAPETLDDASVREINEAFASGEPARILDKLGHIAKARGMSQVSKHAGLARESLYRSLAADGNPEFTTVLKILSSVGPVAVGKPYLAASRPLMNDKQTETRHRIPTSQQLVFAPVYVSEAHERATWSVNVALPVDVEAALARYINAEEARVWTTLIHEALYLYRRRFYSDEALAGELRNMLETRMRDMDDGHGIEITPAWRASFMERARQRFERMRELKPRASSATFFCRKSCTRLSRNASHRENAARRRTWYARPYRI